MLVREFPAESLLSSAKIDCAAEIEGLFDYGICFYERKINTLFRPRLEAIWTLPKSSSHRLVGENQDAKRIWGSEALSAYCRTGIGSMHKMGNLSLAYDNPYPPHQ